MKEKRLTTKKMVIILSTVLITVLSLLFVFIKLNKQNINFNNNSEEINYIQESDQTIIKEEEEKNEQVIEDYYDVTFYDEDGKVLFNKVYKYGDIPSCDEKIPNKTIEGITYTFKSWSPLFHEVEENQTYVATYKALLQNNSIPSEPVIITKESSSVYIPDPTDAIITYNDASGIEKELKLPKDTIIYFSAGEHGSYTTTPSEITLSSKQELDITTNDYTPTSIEVNYIFKGFSYSGNTFTAMYEKASNIVNYEIKRSNDVIIKNNVAYNELDYIESTGTQCIDLGIKPIPNRKIEVDFKFVSYLSGSVIFGCRDGDTSGRFDCFANNTNQLCFRTTEVVASGDTFKTIDLSSRHTISLMFDSSKQYVGIDGVLTNVNKTPRTFNSNIYLFNRSITSYDSNAFSNSKIYGTKVYDNGALVLDLIPVIKLTDNTRGMLDTLSGVFYGNSGVGVFNSNAVDISPDLLAGKIYASGSYEAGQTLTLSVSANTGYSFVGWLDGNTDNPRNITVGDNKTYTALFKSN